MDSGKQSWRVAWTEEALRLNARYTSEVIEAFDLCPWAKTARKAGRIMRHVQLQDELGDAALAESHEAVEALAAHPDWEIGFVIFPRIDQSEPKIFRDYVSALQRTHVDRYERGKAPIVMAAFHPNAELNMDSPAQLVSYLRRSPDPTIQLVKNEVLAKVVKGPPSGSVFASSLAELMKIQAEEPKLNTSERIAQTNLERVQQEGPSVLEEILEDIAADRRRSYEGLRRPPPSA